MISDLTLLPPPETEFQDTEPESPADDDTLMDFTGGSGKMTSPPAGFTDLDQTHGLTHDLIHGLIHDTSMDSLPAGVNDLPPSIRDRIDSMIANDEELGTQMAAMDALMIGNYAPNTLSWLTHS